MTADEHVDIDTLADDAAGLTDRATSQRVAEHLAACPQCRAHLAALDDVSRKLRALPRPAMPEPVADRIDAALRTATQGPHTVVPLQSRPPGRRGVRLAGLAAAAAGVALVGALIASHVVGGGTGSGDAGNATAGGAASAAAAGGPSPAQARALQAVETTRLPGYSSTDLVRRLSADVAGGSTSAAPSTTAQTRTPHSADSAQQQGTVARSLAHPPASRLDAAAVRALAPLRAPARMFNCVRQVTDSPAVTIPHAVQFTTYQGKPAVVIVVPNPSEPSQLTAFVAGPRCGAPDAVSADLIIYVGLSH